MNRFSRNYKSLDNLSTLPRVSSSDNSPSSYTGESLLTNYRQSRSHRGRTDESLLSRRQKPQVFRVSEAQNPSGYNTHQSKDLNRSLAEEILDEAILEPTIEEEIYRCLWEMIFKTGRDMTDDKFEILKMRKNELSIPMTVKEKLNPRMLQNKNWMEKHSTENLLSAYSWNRLIFNYRMNLEQNSFRTNGALKILQEKMFRQIAIDEISKEVLQIMEDRQEELEDDEKDSLRKY